MFSLTLPYPPAVNRLYRTIVRGRRAMPIKSREARDYVNAVQARWLAAEMPRVPDGPVAVLVRLYRPRRTGDIDGPIKALLDSLNGLAWGDDAQITELHVFRGDDKHDPRAVLEVWALDADGQRVEG